MPFEFHEGSTEAAIVKILSAALDFVLPRADIIDKSGKTENSIRSALYRMRKKGILTNYLDGLVQKGYWKLVRLYRKIRHTKRIVETRQAKSHREWNCDCEATSEGFVPYSGYVAPPDRPSESVTKKYANVLNPKLKDIMLDILHDNGILLKDSMTVIEPTCQPKFFRVPKYCIEGTEWLDEITGDFDPIHEVEVVFVNDVGEFGKRYDKNEGAGIWTGNFQVSESEFNF